MIAQDIEKVLLSEEEIENRCVELAHQIEEDYKESGETPIVVGLLKGSVPFMAELIKRLDFHVKLILCPLVHTMEQNLLEMFVF